MIETVNDTAAKLLAVRISLPILQEYWEDGPWKSENLMTILCRIILAAVAVEKEHAAERGECCCELCMAVSEAVDRGVL